ncbi:MAG TPA: arginine--tRNA ligase [Oligoflexia bacterium]|nr:arginine--tRNA ligase [Oligoflexia bacterium]HMP49077.1 arginine--tRNA ligase [Oligoflexia bacterium]
MHVDNEQIGALSSGKSLADGITENLATRISFLLKQAGLHETQDSELRKLFEAPKKQEHGDICFPCFSHAKKLGLQPPALAKKLEEELVLPVEILNAQSFGPFLNFKYNFELLFPKMLEIIQTGYCHLRIPKGQTVIVEYSSPNIAKPFHVGHLRATLIGNSLDRLHRFAGFKVESINHLGDWGTQFGFVWAGTRLWGIPKDINVSSLVELYKKATSLKEEQEKNPGAKPLNETESVNEMARSYFLKLEAGEKDAVTFWKTCVDASLIYLKKTYQRLSISFDHYLGESFYSDKMANMEQELRENSLLKESEGALGVELGDDLGFARISTPDGRSLYLTRDLAAANYRFNRFNFCKSLYVVGAPQTLHFKQLFKISELLKKPYAGKLEHIAFGHVLGMKTRGEGQAIELNEFLDEAKERALQAYRSQVSKRPEGLNESEVAEKVAIAAVIFSTLNRTNIKDVHFSWEDALSFQGDSGPYLLYAYARISGIATKAKEQSIGTPSTKFAPDTFKNPEALALMASILEFDQVLTRTLNSLEPMHLCTYALQLAKCISKCYLSMKVIGEEKEIAETNLAIFLAGKEMLGTIFSLLGFKPLERM